MHWDLSKRTVNLSKGTVRLSKGTVNISKGTVNLSKETVSLSKGTVNLSKGTVNTISSEQPISEVTWMIHNNTLKIFDCSLRYPFFISEN